MSHDKSIGTNHRNGEMGEIHGEEGFEDEEWKMHCHKQEKYSQRIVHGRLWKSSVGVIREIVKLEILILFSGQVKDI